MRARDEIRFWETNSGLLCIEAPDSLKQNPILLYQDLEEWVDELKIELLDDDLESDEIKEKEAKLTALSEWKMFLEIQIALESVEKTRDQKRETVH